MADFTAIFRQIAAALNAAHAAKRQIIHRDLKPANVMVWKDGAEWRVKVIDFGLAVRGAIRTTSVSVPHLLRATREKAVTGTIKYAAPEQLGEKAYPVGPHSDVFAFGKTALESLFGTVQPTPKHWKQLPDPLADLLARCVDEEYDPSRPDEGRFHGFAPVLAVLAPTPVTPTPLPTPKPQPAPSPLPVPPPQVATVVPNWDREVDVHPPRVGPPPKLTPPVAKPVHKAAIRLLSTCLAG